jgi:hypothetical protein
MPKKDLSKFSTCIIQNIEKHSLANVSQILLKIIDWQKCITYGDTS